MPFINAVYCFLAALIWGTAFVAQKIGGDVMGPLSFNGIRSLLGFCALLPLVIIRGHHRNRFKDREPYVSAPYNLRTSIIGGMTCGFFLCLGSTLQQISIGYTDVGKAGFLTALYMVLVPVLSFFMTGRSSKKVWTAVCIALAGLYCLCMKSGEGLHIAGADYLLILCALVYAMQIMSVDHFVALTDGIEIAAGQLLTTGVVCTILAVIIEHPDPRMFGIDGWLSLLYAGIMSSGIAYTLQVVGQKGADPAIASLIMSLESVISAISGFVFLHQRLSSREVLGCVLMFSAIILVQLPVKRKAAEPQHQ